MGGNKLGPKRSAHRKENDRKTDRKPFYEKRLCFVWSAKGLGYGITSGNCVYPRKHHTIERKKKVLGEKKRTRLTFNPAVRYLSSSSGISSISSVVGLATGIPSRRLTMSSRSVPTSLVAAASIPFVISG